MLPGVGSSMGLMRRLVGWCEFEGGGGGCSGGGEEEEDGEEEAYEQPSEVDPCMDSTCMACLPWITDWRPPGAGMCEGAVKRGAGRSAGK